MNKSQTTYDIEFGDGSKIMIDGIEYEIKKHKSRFDRVQYSIRKVKKKCVNCGSVH